jgi:hypothetical protein
LRGYFSFCSTTYLNAFTQLMRGILSQLKHSFYESHEMEAMTEVI